MEGPVSRAHNADRLLIRPASGRQAGTGLSARTDHWKDIHQRSHSGVESRTKSTDANLTNAPDGTATHSQFGNVPRVEACLEWGCPPSAEASTVRPCDDSGGCMTMCLFDF